MQTILLSILFAAGLFVGVFACLRIGWSIGRKRLVALGEDGQAGLGALDGAVFGLITGNLGDTDPCGQSRQIPALVPGRPASGE